MNMKMTVIGFDVLMSLKIVFELWLQSEHILLFQSYFFKPMCFPYFFDSFLIPLLKQVFKIWLINKVMEILQ